jgi:uncharacterized protein (TIGR03437 family)
VVTGQSAPASAPFAQVSYPYQITVNGQSVQVPFFGYAPGFIGLVQADIILPIGLTGNLSLVVTVNGQSSAPTLLSVQ